MLLSVILETYLRLKSRGTTSKNHWYQKSLFTRCENDMLLLHMDLNFMVAFNPVRLNHMK